MCRTVVSALFSCPPICPSVSRSFFQGYWRRWRCLLAQVQGAAGADVVLGGAPAPPQRVEWHFAARVPGVKSHLRQEDVGLAPKRGNTCANNGTPTPASARIGPCFGPVQANTAQNACMGPTFGPVRAVIPLDLWVEGPYGAKSERSDAGGLGD